MMAIRCFLVLVIVSLASCAAVVPTGSERATDVLAEKSDSVWCQVNPSRFGEPLDWVKLPKDSIHVVRTGMQAKAKAALTERSVVELTKKNVKLYLRDGETISGTKRIYLVRGAAYYVNKDYELMQNIAGKLPIDAFYYPSRKMISVVNYALARGNVDPTNLALIIESENVVMVTRASCLSAE